MKNQKVIYITIIVLLCIFLPLTIIGFIFRDDKNLLDENPGHDTYYKGKIWFYDDNDKLLSSYECQTEICEFTVPTIDDAAYGINYYGEGTMEKVPVVDNKYTFITDGAVIYLYNVTNGTTLGTYKAVKNYNTSLENNAFIVQNQNGLWGVLTIGSTLSSVLPFEYDFVGLINKTNEDGTLNTDKFIVRKNNKWHLVDVTGVEPNAITGEIEDPIVDYTDYYVISKNMNKVRIHSYENYEYLTNYSIKDYVLEDKYIGIITDNFLLIYDNLGSNYLKDITLTGITGEIDLELSNNNLNVKVDNEVIETIEVN